MLQPNFFMQNLLGQARQIAADGRIYQPAGDAKASFGVSMAQATRLERVSVRSHAGERELTRDGGGPRPRS